MNDDKITQLQQRERELRDSLKDVQETVLDLNNEAATLSGRRDEVRAMLKAVEKQRHEAERAEQDRRKRLGADHPSLHGGDAGDALETQRVTLDHARARLQATEEKIDGELQQLDDRRRPFVQSQRQMLKQINDCVKRQHQLRLNPNLPTHDPTLMTPSNKNAFRQSGSGPTGDPDGHPPKPLASVARLEELKKQLDKPSPAPQLNPPGMTPNVGKHVRDSKAIGDEIVRIQQAIAERRGQAREGFKRSAKG